MNPRHTYPLHFDAPYRAGRSVEHMLHNVTYETFERDELLPKAVRFDLLGIGEVVTSILRKDRAFTQRYPDTDGNTVVSFRDPLIHGPATTRPRDV